jgi:hypothetical protein
MSGNKISSLNELIETFEKEKDSASWKKKP